MDGFLEELRDETVIESSSRDVEHAEVPSFSVPVTPKLHTNRKVFVEKPTRFVQIDANKLRYLLDERPPKKHDVVDEVEEVHPLLDWAVTFQHGWNTWTLFLAGILAGFGAFQLVLLGVMKRGSFESTEFVSAMLTPSTTIVNFLYVWTLLGSLDKCDFAGIDTFNVTQPGRISSIICAMLYLTGFVCSLTVVHLEDLKRFSTVWFVLSSARAAIPVLCWMFFAKSPKKDAFARRLSTLRFENDENRSRVALEGKRLSRS